jgi:hypothetical protein
MPHQWQLWLAFAVMVLAVAAFALMLIIDSTRLGIFGP